MAKQTKVICRQRFQGKEPDRARFTRLWAELLRRAGR